MKLHVRNVAVAQVVNTRFFIVSQRVFKLLVAVIIFAQLVAQHLNARLIMLLIYKSAGSSGGSRFIHFKTGNNRIILRLKLRADRQFTVRIIAVSYIFKQRISEAELLFLVQFFSQFKVSIRIHISQRSLRKRIGLYCQNKRCCTQTSFQYCHHSSQG